MIQGGSQTRVHIYAQFSDSRKGHGRTPKQREGRTNRTDAHARALNCHLNWQNRQNRQSTELPDFFVAKNSGFPEGGGGVVRRYAPRVPGAFFGAGHRQILMDSDGLILELGRS